MNRIIAILFVFSVSLLNIQCSDDDPVTLLPPPSKPGGEVIGKAQIWTTNTAGTQLLDKLPAVEIYGEALSTDPDHVIDRA